MASLRSRQRYGKRVSGADALLGKEDAGLALDFTDDSLQSLAGHYGSARVRDNTTLANNFIGVPYDLLTYTSPSAKMCMGPTGLLRFGAHNLFTQSDTFSAANWPDLTAGTGVAPTRTAAYAAGPPGSNSLAYRMQLSLGGGTTSSDISGFRQAVTGISGAPYEDSFWLRSTDGSSSYAMQIIGIDGAGTAITVTGSWQRFSVTSNGTGGASNIGIRLRGGQTPVNAATADVLVAMGHVRRTPSDSSYMATTTAARYAMPFEWSSAGVQQGILVEEARTNLVTYSCDLTQSSIWSNANTTDAKTATGPDGVANSASTITASAANGAIWCRPTSASATRITSLYIKRRTGSGGVFLAKQSATATQITGFDGTFATSTGWTAGAGVTITGGVAQCSGASAFVLNTGNVLTIGKPYIVTFTISNYSAGSVQPRAGNQGSGTSRSANGTYTEAFTCQGSQNFHFNFSPAFTGDIDDVTIFEADETTLTVTSSWARVSEASNTSANPLIALRLATSGDEVDVCLVQNEVGAFITSPIPTVGATATRAVDNISLATSAFPYSAVAWTVLAEWANVAGGSRGVWGLGLNAANEALANSLNRALYVSTASSNVADLSPNAAYPGGFATGRIASAATANDFAASYNGSAVSTDTSGNMPSAAITLQIGREVANAANLLNGYIRRLVYIPRRLPNADLQYRSAP